MVFRFQFIKFFFLFRFSFFVFKVPKKRVTTPCFCSFFICLRCLFHFVRLTMNEIFMERDGKKNNDKLVQKFQTFKTLQEQTLPEKREQSTGPTETTVQVPKQNKFLRRDLLCVLIEQSH